MLLLSQYDNNAKPNSHDDQNGPESPSELSVPPQPAEDPQGSPNVGAETEEPIDYEERREKALKDAQDQWAQRRKDGYEDYGAEMGKDAKVWEIYVKETDRADHELVQGWNKSLDVLLIFAALFSAISTAFVIVSSEGLQQDPADTSAQTLLAISQALVAISNGQPVNASATTDEEPSASFKPTRAAMIVNTLWYFSLSLSVAVSLVTMLAKEWCYSFMANRTGQMYEQGRRRQERWEGILRWKMKDVIAFLPMVMHSALFLFALGLCVYLWSISIPVALPVVVTTGVALLIYFSTTVLPLLFDFCPYATESSKLLQSYFFLIHRGTGALLHRMAKPPQRKFIDPQERFGEWKRLQRLFLLRTDSILKSCAEALVHLRSVLSPTPVEGALVADPKLIMTNGKVPMDITTSKMLAWLLENSEDATVTTIALKSLAGADPWLPRLPLIQNGVLNLLHQRVDGYLEIDVQLSGYRLRDPLLIHNMSLYFRSLNYILSLHNSEGFYLAYEHSFNSYHEDGDMLRFAVAKTTWKLDGITYEVGGPLTAGTYESILEVPVVYEVLYDLNLFGYIHTQAVAFTDAPESPGYTNAAQQRSEVVATLQRYIDGTIALHPHSIIAAVRHETERLCTQHTFDRSSLDEKLVFSIILVRISLLPSLQKSPEVLHTIAVALMVSAFVTNEYPGWDHASVGSGQAQSRSSAAAAYHYQPKLLIDRRGQYRSLEASRRKETESLLAFGLLSLLEHPDTHVLCDTNITTIVQAIESLGRNRLRRDHITYAHIHTLSKHFTYSDHYVRVMDQLRNPDQGKSKCHRVKKWRCIQVLHDVECTTVICSHWVAHLKGWCQAESPELCAIFLGMIVAKPFNPHELELRNLFSSNNVLAKLDSALLLSTNAQNTLDLVEILWTLVNWIYRNSQREDPVRQALRSITPKSDSEIPDSIWSLGLIERWLPKLRSVYSTDPKMVIQSRVVRHILWGFEDKWDHYGRLGNYGGLENPPSNIVERAAQRYQQLPGQCRQTASVEALHKLAFECVLEHRKRIGSAPLQLPPNTQVPRHLIPQATLVDTDPEDDDDTQGPTLPGIIGAEMC